MREDARHRRAEIGVEHEREAMTGSGQPTERRMASRSATIRIVPIATSTVVGLPTRKARSWKIQGT